MTERCPTCGHARTMWTRPVILDAMRAWQAEHGAPPKFDQWRHATPDHPGYRTVYEMFGGWSNALREAGLRPRRHNWDRDKVKVAVFQWVYDHGRPPKAREWSRACPDGKHPSSGTCVRLFGSWSAAMHEAGYRPARDMGGDLRPRAASGGRFVAA